MLRLQPSVIGITQVELYEAKERASRRRRQREERSSDLLNFREWPKTSDITWGAYRTAGPRSRHDSRIEQSCASLTSVEDVDGGEYTTSPSSIIAGSCASPTSVVGTDGGESPESLSSIIASDGNASEPTMLRFPSFHSSSHGTPELPAPHQASRFSVDFPDPEADLVNDLRVVADEFVPSPVPPRRRYRPRSDSDPLGAQVPNLTVGRRRHTQWTAELPIRTYDSHPIPERTESEETIGQNIRASRWHGREASSDFAVARGGRPSFGVVARVPLVPPRHRVTSSEQENDDSTDMLEGERRRREERLLVLSLGGLLERTPPREGRFERYL